jgi:signal transduction histidine kinase/ActR/RegA family two-component response regulator
MLRSRTAGDRSDRRGDAASRDDVHFVSIAMAANSSIDEAPTSAMSEADADALVADVLEGIASAALVFARDGHLRAVNRAARARFVIDPKTTLAAQPLTRVLDTVADVALPMLNSAVAGTTTGAQQRLLVLAGRSLLVRLAPLAESLLLLTVADVTDEERQDAALAQSERELRAMFELTPSSVRVADVSGRIVRLNANAVSEHIAPQPQTLRELWAVDQPRRLEDDAPLAYPDHPAIRALAGRTVRRELIAVRRAGFAEPRVIETNAAPILDENGRVSGVVLLDRDVTDSRRLERILDEEVLRSAELESRVRNEADRIEQIVEERARALAARDDAQARDRRLSAIGQLAAGVMHDVNNALNPIMAAAYLLRHHAESPDAVRDYADRIRKAAETGAATASRVGRFIRQEPMHSGADELLDLSLLAEEVLELTEPMRMRTANESTRVRVARHYDHAVLARGVPGEIREALLNLISNAMDAMPTGGELTIRTAVAGDEALLSVADTGVGMSAEVQERAFEPFFTTKGAGGSGLGLAEVYGIARRHRGTVSIVSESGGGTCVSLRLPLDRTALPPREEEQTFAPSSPLHILIVEDHEDGREFLRRLLTADGHTVEAVATCADARERLASAGSSAYHLILTDVGLPDGSGWELVAFVRERMPTLRIGVITGWEPMVSSAEAVGAEFVLRKPIRAAELLSHIAGRRAPALPE